MFTVFSNRRWKIATATTLHALRLIENKYGHLNTEKQSKACESTALHGNKTGENSPQAKFQRTLKKNKNLALPRIYKT